MTFSQEEQRDGDTWGVRLLELEENRGFTGACNAGYAAAQGEVVVLLNNDTEADEKWLQAIVDAFERHPDSGIVASKIEIRMVRKIDRRGLVGLGAVRYNQFVAVG